MMRCHKSESAPTIFLKPLHNEKGEKVHENCCNGYNQVFINVLHNEMGQEVYQNCVTGFS